MVFFVGVLSYFLGLLGCFFGVLVVLGGDSVVLMETLFFGLLGCFGVFCFWGYRLFLGRLILGTSCFGLQVVFGWSTLFFGCFLVVS